MFNSLTTNLLVILVSIIVGLLTYVQWQYSYWKRKGVIAVEPHWFFGNMKEFFLRKKSIGKTLHDLYKSLQAKGATVGGGVYGAFNKTFLVISPDLARSVMLKDFSYFPNRGLYVDEVHDPLTSNLINLEDEKWQNLRQKLTPTFTSGKMKMMFETLAFLTNGLNDLISEEADSPTKPINIKEILARFTTDVIGSCAFGLDCNSMKDPNSEFRKYGKRILEPANLWEKMRPLMVQIFPKPFLRAIKFKGVKPDVSDFIMKTVKKTVEYRENNNVFRKDFLHLLIQLKNMGEVTDNEKLLDKNKKQVGLTLNELAAQVFIFFLAGFETSSTTMTFALSELAINQDIQEKLRLEIREVLAKHDGNITYEGIAEMKYLDKVVSETLRRHPPVPVVPRVCKKPYKVPGMDLTLEPGIRVHIPILGYHLDSKYYPDPLKFDPERFDDENKAKRHPFVYLPFGEGPRMCIGVRFGLMQSKVGLVAIINNFNVTMDSKTKYPFEMGKYSIVNSIDGDLWLNIKKFN